jgi:hypothetical protein
MRSSRTFFWVAFVVFVVCALYFDRHDHLWSFAGPLAPIKAIVWLAFVAFLGFTIFASARENLFRSIDEIGELYWGRQIGIDLYIGLLIFMFFVYLNEGSALVMLCWLVPSIAFVNLATLLYLAMHFEEIVSKFLG